MLSGMFNELVPNLNSPFLDERSIYLVPESTIITIMINIILLREVPEPPQTRGVAIIVRNHHGWVQRLEIQKYDGIFVVFGFWFHHQRNAFRCCHPAQNWKSEVTIPIFQNMVFHSNPTDSEPSQQPENDMWCNKWRYDLNKSDFETRNEKPTNP